MNPLTHHAFFLFFLFCRFSNHVSDASDADADADADDADGVVPVGTKAKPVHSPRPGFFFRKGTVFL